jgi:hypothetical protein
MKVRNQPRAPICRFLNVAIIMATRMPPITLKRRDRLSGLLHEYERAA